MTADERAKYYLESVKPRLIEFGARMCNASGMDDDVLHEVAFQELIQFYEELSSKGYWHPWLTEALADFCPEAKRALGFYEKAREEVKALNGPQHTILLGLLDVILNSARMSKLRLVWQKARLRSSSQRIRIQLNKH